jgi:hypothetical protein
MGGSRSQILRFLLLVPLCAFVSPPSPAGQADVGVYLLEFYQTNQILVHLNAAPSKTNILQYSSSLSKGAVWSNLFVAPVLPFTNHYVIVDTNNARATPQRYYRLLVLP